MHRQPYDRNAEHTTEERSDRSDEAPRIAVVTPAYKEEKNLTRVGASVLAQSLKPNLWVIVDDGSSDGTSRIANKLAEGQGWISVTKKERDSGITDGSFTAFSFGVSKIGFDWHYLMKLDADTALPQDFLTRLVERFESNPDLGIASGVCAGEPGLGSHPRGNNRMYRRECWDEITFPDGRLRLGYRR